MREKIFLSYFDQSMDQSFVIFLLLFSKNKIEREKWGKISKTSSEPVISFSLKTFLLQMTLASSYIYILDSRFLRFSFIYLFFCYKKEQITIHLLSNINKSKVSKKEKKKEKTPN
mgnify:CR=1 FL=1